jgi:hypothetical protein
VISSWSCEESAAMKSVGEKSAFHCNPKTCHELEKSIFIECVCNM